MIQLLVRANTNVPPTSRKRRIPPAQSADQQTSPRSIGARSIVEFGTSFGLSTLHLASALRDNGGGRLITSEFEPAKVARAKAHLAAGGLADPVEFREGDALETLAVDLPDRIDLLLLDGAKALYSDVLALVERRLRPGAVIVADNADYCPEYLERVAEPTDGYLSMPFTDDVELTIRLAWPCGR